jgi:predicted ATPase
MLQNSTMPLLPRPVTICLVVSLVTAASPVSSQVATIELRAGRRAKESAAYASASAYFSAGMALLNEKDWGSQYELTFSLWLERAECELLTSNFDTAEQLILELLQRSACKIQQAGIYHLKVQLHEVKGEYPQAVTSGLARD